VKTGACPAASRAWSEPFIAVGCSPGRAPLRRELANLAKRYSPLTIALLTGAFALLGYMGARVSEQQASREAHPPAPAFNGAGERKAAAGPSECIGTVAAARTPADAVNPVGKPADAQTPLAALMPPHENAGEGMAINASSARAPAETSGSMQPLNAGSVEASRGPGLDAGKGETLSNRTDAARSGERELRIDARAAEPPQPDVSESETQAEKPRGKPTRTQQSRYREVAEEGRSPLRSYSRRLAARGDMPPLPGPGHRLLPFLPFFLPF